MTTIANYDTAIQKSDRYFYQKRGATRQQLQNLKLRRRQRDFIEQFLGQHLRLISLVAVLILAGACLEILLPLAAHRWKTVIVNSFGSEYFFRYLPLAGVYIAAYLIVTALVVLFEQKLIRIFSNSIRLLWIDAALKRHRRGLNGTAIGRLLARITYHLSLLEAGLQQAVSTGFRWLLVSIGLFVVAAVVDPLLLSVVLGAFVLQVLVIGLGYFLGKRYVSREQTLSSRIIRYATNALYDTRVPRDSTLRAAVAAELEALMTMDTFFRVRRSLWIRLMNVVLFVVFALCAVMWTTAEISFGISIFDDSNLHLIFGIVLVIIVQQFYSAARIGLFWYPLKIGLKICIPFARKPRSPVQLELVDRISLQAARANLGHGKPRTNDFSLQVVSGQRLQVVSQNYEALAIITKILSGTASYHLLKQWRFRVNDTKYPYDQWRQRSDVLYIDPLFQTDVQILDWLLGTSRTKPHTSEKLTGVLEAVVAQPDLSFVLRLAGELSAPMDDESLTLLDRGLLQLARCLVNPPAVLIIDRVWLSIDDGRFRSLLTSVSAACPNVILILMSEADTGLSYETISI